MLCNVIERIKCLIMSFNYNNNNNFLHEKSGAVVSPLCVLSDVSTSYLI